MRRLTLALLMALAASVLMANVFIQRVGLCAPGGPCLIPVGFGLMAPSGVLWVPVALLLRDALHEAGGSRWVAGGVLLGAALSAALSPALALASGLAFALSEGADWLVYAGARRRSLALAVLLSGAVGILVDSAAFLLLAFGSLDYLAGQVVGKSYGVLLGAALVWVWGRMRAARATAQAALGELP